MYLLDNTPRPYAWGAERAIADLLGREPSGGPEAELWVGAHPGSSSQVLYPDGSRRGLDKVIEENPAALLGEDMAARFDGRLPFLLKVLAAGSALSLQVHPSLEQAAAGFGAEEADGVPRDAPHRKYRDRNHKPEMIFALTPFEALCGFRPLPESVAIFTLLASMVEPASAARELLEAVAVSLTAGDDGALRTAFTSLLEAPQQVVADVEAAVEAGAVSGGASGAASGAVAGADQDDEASAARDLATVAELSDQYPGDPGVLIALLLNRVSLQSGDALYLPAGNIHAYLGGLGIEVMASSDNVLRGGLTPKHVDRDELLATVIFKAFAPPTVVAEFTLFDQELYRPPFEEFQLQRIVLGDAAAGASGTEGTADRADSSLPPGGSVAPAHVPVLQNGPVVVLAVSGPILLDSPNATLTVPRGSGAFVAASEAPLVVRPAADAHGATDGPVLAFAVTVGGEGSSL